MEEKKKRGRPLGIPRAETAGRKATGRIRNKTFNFKVTEEEKEKIFEILDLTGLKRTDGLIKILEEYEKNLHNCKKER